MEKLALWLQNKYLEHQREHGLISAKEWAEYLGVGYTTLMGIFTGDRPSTSMQTAYQIGERLNDFSILELLGYPIPDAPLVGFTNEQREIILDFLGNVKQTLGGLPPDVQDAKLKEIVEAAGFMVTDSD